MAKTAAFLKAPVSATRGEHIAMAGVTGVAVGTANNGINQHYVARAHGRYKAHRLRRIEGMHGELRKGGAK